MSPLSPPDSHDINSAEGWLGLGNHIVADAELDRITASLRSHPQVLEVRWRIYARAKKWDACVDIGEAMDRDAIDLPVVWIYSPDEASRRTMSGSVPDTRIATIFP